MLARDAGGKFPVRGRGNAFEDIRAALAQASPGAVGSRSWAGICRLLQDRMGTGRFLEWIGQVTHVTLDDETLTVLFAGRRARNEAQARLLDTVTSCARAVTQRPLRVAFAVGAAPVLESPEAPTLRAHRAAAAAPAACAFQCGPCNDSAVKALRAYVAAERVEYCPLLVYGSPGTGKTRLLELAREIAADGGRLRTVLRATAEEFTQQFTFSLQRGKLPAFQQKYRSPDLLLIDDVHRLANRTATQDEFLHTFDTLEQSGRRMILASLWPGRDLAGFSRRLRVRLKSGLEVKLDAPDPEFRRALLARWGQERGRPPAPDAAERVAARVEGSIGTLRRVFDTVAALRCPGPAQVDEAITSVAGAASRPITLEDISSAVAKSHGMRAEELRADDRCRRVTRPRQIAFALARGLTAHALGEIGAYFGGRNSATVLAGQSRVKERMEADLEFRARVEALEREIRERR